MSQDAFEEAEMHDGAKVVWRDKRVARGMAGILTIPVLINLVFSWVIATGNATADRPLDPAALWLVVGGMVLMAAIFAVMAIAFAVLRTVVTERALHVKYGLWGPTILLEAIVTARVVPYKWTSYGGWGIRRGADGSWAYVASGGDVLEVVYEEGGKQRKVLIGANDPRRVLAALDEARRAAAARADQLEPVPSGKITADREMEALAEEQADLEAAREGRVSRL